MQYDQNDLESLALVAWREARGDGTDAMRAVMHVIVNRVAAPGFPKTIHEVIFQKNAFSSMTVPGDKEFNLQPAFADPQHAYCMNAAYAVLNNADTDLTRGAHYYDVVGTQNGWFTRVISGLDEMGTPGHPFTVQIGRQRFYV